MIKASACLLFLFLVAGCEKAIETPRDKGQAPRPSLVFEGFQAFGNRGESRQWQAWAERAELYNESNQARVRQIKIHYFQNDKVVSVLKADRGEIDTSGHHVTATGKVVLKGENGIVLTTDRLHWDHARERISTDSRVKVVQKDRVLTGRGLVSDRNLERVEVLHDVEITARSLSSLRQLDEEFDE